MSESDMEFWNDAFEEDPDEVNVKDRFLAAEVAGLQPGTALDLGCGSGPNALMLAEQGWSVTGVDWAERAIALAQKSAAERGLDATFYAADISTWQPPGQFDLVISTYALPGGETSRRVLATAAAALAPGGTLIVIEWDRSMTEAWGFEEDDLMSPEQIARLLPALEIETAEVRSVENAFGSADDPGGDGGSTANAALVRAHKPPTREARSS